MPRRAISSVAANWSPSTKESNGRRSPMSDDRPRIISRRDILRRAGLAGAAAVAAPAAALSAAAAPATTEPALQAQSPAAPPREAFENLTATEAELLEAIVERQVPSDQHGPGAREARAAHY